ncbi:glutamine amidotransferase [Bogoriella caseilytica]|nr:glutamine amidotransferase [Bogoriella caseilytica]
MRKPFLLLASRAEDHVADEEYSSLLRLGDLAESELVRMRMEAGPLPALDLDDYAGVILGGSPFTVSVPWEDKTALQRRVELELSGILREIRAKDLPFLGLCYGVGALTRSAGGVVDSVYGEEPGAVQVELTEAGQHDPLLREVAPRFTAFVGHKEACSVLPPGAELLATSTDCPVQMYRLGAHIYVTQFHPELDRASIITRLQAYRGQGYFREEELDRIIAAVATADVESSHAVLHAFVQRYRERPAAAA